MIWKDENFLSIYRPALIDLTATLRLKADHAAQELAARRAAGREMIWGGMVMGYAGRISGACFTEYVNGAIAVFDGALARLKVAPSDADVDEFARLVHDALTKLDPVCDAFLSGLGGPEPLVAEAKRQIRQRAERQLARWVSDAKAANRFLEKRRLELERVVFVSHVADDKDLAIALKRSLEAYLGPGVEVFVSSHPESIRAGKDAKNRIQEMLRRAGVCVTIVTPRAIKSRWPYYESAFIEARERPVFPCRARGAGWAEIGPPLNWPQGLHLANVDELRTLHKEISTELQLVDHPAVEGFGDVVREALRPSLRGLTDAAMALCREISTQSKAAETGAPARLELMELESKLGIDRAPLQAAAGELERDGLAKLDGALAEGFQKWVFPTVKFFLEADPSFVESDAVDDARALARATLESPDDGVVVDVIARQFGWPPRRMNPALYVLDAKTTGAVKRLSGNPDFSYPHIFKSPSLRTFASEPEE